MGFYDNYILPKLVHWVCQQNPSMRQREKIVPLANGNVLEIGIGTGLNIPFYNSQFLKQLIAIDPSNAMWKQTKAEVSNLNFPFDFIQATAENLPFESNKFDTVVMTYTLCSITNTNKALEEIKRVLKPNGKLLFCEHGKAPDLLIQKWQNRLNPIWKRVGGGCHLNKDIPNLIEQNGFRLNNLNSMYIPGWKPASYNYWGIAKLY